ncbi:10340_t:CDS:2 [Paraglomus brasilianum]|uniref:10340_t:CDS:1 n=1 Tax=Paraglomus brasilianum TaxID=144538 RepID=A0A9N9DD97_9GLOM|nr:10340_t:CDS:2 [Paraglomus brasilianum]
MAEPDFLISVPLAFFEETFKYERRRPENFVSRPDELPGMQNDNESHVASCREEVIPTMKSFLIIFCVPEEVETYLQEYDRTIYMKKGYVEVKRHCCALERHENTLTMIAAKLDLEYAIKSVEELERLLQVSNRFLPGCPQNKIQIEDEYWISYLDSIAFPAMDADVRKALRNLNSLDCAFEEIERAKIEMTRMKEYSSQRLDAINSAMENLNDADGEDKALMNGCLVWLRKEKDVVLEMTVEVYKVFGESNADNMAREDEIENYLYGGEVSIDFNDIDETMYEYGENDNIDMEIIT